MAGTGPLCLGPKPQKEHSGDPSKGTPFLTLRMALLNGTLLRGSISPSDSLILNPTKPQSPNPQMEPFPLPSPQDQFVLPGQAFSSVQPAALQGISLNDLKISGLGFVA